MIIPNRYEIVARPLGLGIYFVIRDTVTGDLDPTYYPTREAASRAIAGYVERDRRDAS